MSWITCVAVFLATYSLNMIVISVFYHRGLTHGAVRFGPRTRRLVGRLGVWTTGIDPKAWVCMHRQHHQFSDAPSDPHSPVHQGFWGVLTGQLRSYESALRSLIRHRPQVERVVEDLDFEVSWPNRIGHWYLPYLAHLLVAVLIAAVFGSWALGLSYWLGMMSHPIQGWIINSFGHAVGGRNFNTPDNSRNNHIAAWLVLGEGLQNNHHRFPASAKFSFHRHEIDIGFWVCRILEKLRVLEIRREGLIPSPQDFSPGAGPYRGRSLDSGDRLAASPSR